ncbi:MAG: methionyl-tRNA formyltransferase [Bacteroidetes bacterium]|nr:methionyl-tRNA formyltransferase [Bacteroidota bacterium]
MNEKLRIVFFGTPEFAVASLDMLVKNGYNVVGIVTAPDKPAGRGLGLKMSAVKEYANSKNLKTVQPEDLKSEKFIAQLKELKPNLGVVVAFRKLPEQVWKMPAYGTFNLHGSLLPHYRGAAPINWAIINGEKESGVTTFFLDDQIDTGKIIFRAKENISENDTAGELYERLMKDGADLVLKTVRAIESGTYTPEEQSAYVKPSEKLKPAPKIFKENCKINWKKSVDEVHNFVRGLSPYPTAWTEVKKENEVLSLKVFRTLREISEHQIVFGTVLSDGKTFAKVAVKHGFIQLLDLQLAGRKKMNVVEFLRGFSFENWKVNL